MSRARRNKAFVDLQNDVTDSDIAVSVSEGFSLGRASQALQPPSGWRPTRARPRTSMASPLWPSSPDKPSRRPASLEPGRRRFRLRSALSPVSTVANISSRPGSPRPTTGPTGQGASFVEAGQWLRAQWFARPGETDWLQSVVREVIAARTTVGICDCLDAGQDRIERSRRRRLSRSHLCQYLFDACGRQGSLRRDAARGRLCDGRRHHGAACARQLSAVNHHGERRESDGAPGILSPGAVARTRRSDGVGYRAMGAIRGLRTASRSLLQRLFGAAADLSDAAFPYMACGEFCLGRIRARLFRISFSGERAYEIAVPAGFGQCACP